MAISVYEIQPGNVVKYYSHAVGQFIEVQAIEPPQPATLARASNPAISLLSVRVKDGIPSTIRLRRVIYLHTIQSIRESI